MRITIASIGRFGRGPERDLFDLNVKRLKWPVTLKELEDRKGGSGPEKQAREHKLLSDAIPAGAVVIALDERAKPLGSVDFARRLEKFQDQGRRDIAFVIGGADGLLPDMRDRADMLLSFGAMTWPHLMVRPMLAEQLYRAWTIQAGHPYHRA